MVFQGKQEKLNILVSTYKKLDESRKDNIRALTRKLAEIHSEGCCGDMVLQRKCTSVPHIHYV